MDGKQEFTPTGEGPQLKPVVKPNPELVPKRKTGLSSKLTEIRASAHALAEKATLLFGIHTSEAEAAEPTERISPEDARAQLESLAKEEAIHPSEFLSRGRQALQTSAQLKNQVVAEQTKLQEQRLSHQSIIWEIDERVRELERAKGLRRIPAALEKRRLEGQKTDIQRQVGQLEAQIQAKRQFVGQISEQEALIRRKQEETLLAEIGQEIQAIRSEYEQLVQEIFQDGTTLAEIRDAYIQQVITPEFDKIIEYQQLPEDKREAFYSALRAYIEHRDEPEAQRQPYRQELDRLFTDEAGIYGVEDYCGPLLDGGDKKVVQQLVAKIAAEDIAPIKAAVEPELKSWDLRDKFSHIFEKAIEPTDRWNRNENSFGSQILAELNEHNIWRGKDMRFWQAVKSSNAANEIFGEVIQRQDQEYYSDALKVSLSDTTGFYIDLLRYYPTPDAIRNLVIIASARSQNYRTVHANQSLDALSKKSDWKDILDEAEKVYPSLRTARPVLETWNYRENRNNPEVREAAGQFALTILEAKQDDPRLMALATEALPNSVLLEALSKRGVIPESHARTLKETDLFLKTTFEEFLRKRRENPYAPYLRDSFRESLRENLSGLLRSAQAEGTEQQIEVARRLTTLSQMILKKKADYTALNYLCSGEVIGKLKDPTLTSGSITTLLGAYVYCPALARDDHLLSQFCSQFTGEETVRFFNDISTAYSAYREQQLLQVVQLVGNNSLTKERALELPTKADDILSSQLFSLAIEYPDVFFATDQDNEFFRKMSTAYQDNRDIMGEISRVVSNGNLTRELALVFPQQASGLVDKKMEETRFFVLNHADTLIRDSSDLKFLNSVVGEFGRKSDLIIRGYEECLRAGVITLAEKDIVLEFTGQFRVISPATLSGYKESKQAGHEKVYIAQLKALAERMTGSGAITEDERSKPYYKDLLRHVYSNNSGNWGSFESSDGCADRNGDLAEFKIKPRYEIDLLSQSEIIVKAGESLNHSVQDEVQQPILEVAAGMNALGHDKERIGSALQTDIEKALGEIAQKKGLPGIDLDTVTSTEEKMFLVLIDSIYGTRSVDPKRVKDLLITYEFATFEDISDYMAGTRDRVGRANNQDYALLCEVGAFYSDRIKEVNRRLAEAAYNNPQIAALMPEYFKQLSQDSAMAQRQNWINRLQINRLGASESFVKQVSKVLEKRRGRKYEPDEVKEIIRRYEGLTGGVQEKTSTSKNLQTKAFYGQLRSQRERSFEALRVITGEEVDPQKIHLGEINLQQALETETRIKEGEYDQEQFATYTVQRFIDLFDSERTKIEGELAKFVSISGKQREVLYGYITKSKESANARMVGGVCVAGDNPSENKDQNMWNMPNYVQLVFQEPDTLQCQGLVLLHHFSEGGKRILTASINPSSTYLYSIDETALFNGIMESLEQLAQDNNFDMITVSQSKGIRTNRTGGTFEKTMDARIASIGKKFRFNSPQTFSYRPNYQLQDMDVMWERGSV